MYIEMIIENMPKDMLNQIWEFIPDRYKIILNKYYYEKYHYIIEDNAKSPFKLYITYIRKILRGDSQYIFHVLLKKNYNKWKQMKNNKYLKQFKSNNFIECLHLLCIEYNASKCRNELFLYTKET
jgi:hypothetical protein